MTATRPSAALAPWLQAHAETVFIPTARPIGTACPWDMEATRAAVHALRQIVPFCHDPDRCVNPWSIIDPEGLVTQLFP